MSDRFKLGIDLVAVLLRPTPSNLARPCSTCTSEHESMSSKLQQSIEVTIVSSSPRKNASVELDIWSCFANNVDGSNVCQQIVDVCVVVQGWCRSELLRAGGDREAFAEL